MGVGGTSDMSSVSRRAALAERHRVVGCWCAAVHGVAAERDAAGRSGRVEAAAARASGRNVRDREAMAQIGWCVFF